MSTLPILVSGLVLILSLALALPLFYVIRQNTRLRAQLRAADETQRSKDSLITQHAELDTIKDEFISTVSHELRTPLTSIRGALGLLSGGLMGALDPKAQNLLRIAVTNTDRLIRLINDILDLERMQSGRAPLQVRRCSLDDLAQQAVETMTALADTAQVKLDIVRPPHSDQAPAYFDGDPDRILQVLTNLLSNAIKFSPPASVITVSVAVAQDALTLRVADQGRGIPADKLDSVFDRFGQVEASDARQKGGTGLGLAICRTIVAQHNGHIWAESNEQQGRGPGASLLVTLPRITRADPAPATCENCILLCDDDPGVRAVVSEHLRQHGYRILEAESGEQAIEIASAHPVEAILLDLAMPGLSGWQTLQRLKTAPATASIPVVILSVLSPASSGSSGKQAAATAQGWVQKPFHEHLLLSEISRVLQTGDDPAHVLLVEDDADLAAVVIAGFGDAQVRIEHASTRQEAIDRCLLTPPDLLILDLTLPDGDGFSFVDWLRTQPTLRTLPLVVYSGREVSEPERIQLRLGPTQFLTKAKVQPQEVEVLVLNIVRRLRAPGIA